MFELYLICLYKFVNTVKWLMDLKWINCAIRLHSLNETIYNNQYQIAF